MWTNTISPRRNLIISTSSSSIAFTSDCAVSGEKHLPHLKVGTQSFITDRFYRVRLQLRGE